jgi:hypothetical protein
MTSRYVAGHRDIAAGRCLDARTERRRVDEDEQVELEPNSSPFPADGSIR